MTTLRANTMVLALALTLPACKALGGAPTCNEVVTKTVETMVAAQGDNSMLKTEYIPRISAGCEASGAMETYSETAKCVLAAADFDAMTACEGSEAMMKAWLKHSK